ncbi:MAG TPA: NAD(P)H-binding protein [Candidatus Nanopelagicales bacterium]
MRLTLFGATGGTGGEVLRAALAAGHEVTVLVRDAERLGSVPEGVTVEVGDATDPQAVARAVAGAEAVISAIGGRTMGRSTVITDAMTAIVAALPAGTRLLAMSTVGAGGSASQLPLPVRAVLGVVLRNAIADHDGQERVIMASDLDWTIARCVGLTDDPPRGEAHVLTEGRVGGSRIARADVAQWLVANLQDPTWSRQAVTLW